MPSLAHAVLVKDFDLEAERVSAAACSASVSG